MTGAIGTATADGSGNWSFDYSGTTLPEGTYAFTGTATTNTYTSALSQPFLVTVDETTPTVNLLLDSSTADPTPQVRVTAWDSVGMPATATVTLDVDLNNNGNFTDPGETDYATGTGNELLNDGTWTYTYDHAGNMIEKSKGSGLETWFYSYDNLNHLIGVRQTSNGSTNLMLATYTYDVFGDMVQEDLWQTGVGTTTTKHVYDSQTLLIDLTSSNTVQMRYVAGDQPNEWLARQDGSGNTGWYQTDRLGSVIGVTDASGAVVDTITYDAEWHCQVALFRCNPLWS